MNNKKLPKVAIIGRTNVGKSTLINRILQKRVAIVEDKTGVTRDRVEYVADWDNVRFLLVDTGGFEFTDDEMFSFVKEQADYALRDADYIVFMINVQSGITDHDERIIKILRSVKKPVFLVANKCDNRMLEYSASEFWSAGLGQPYPVSSLHGNGVADLLQDIVDMIRDEASSEAAEDKKDVADGVETEYSDFEEEEFEDIEKYIDDVDEYAEESDVHSEAVGSAASNAERADGKAGDGEADATGGTVDAIGGEDEAKTDSLGDRETDIYDSEYDENICKVAILGKPNVGKSSLLNALTKSNRSVVSTVAGTTRDPVNEYMEVNGKTWKLIDTAGIKKRAKKDKGADFYAFVRTKRIIEQCDVAVVLIDASEEVTEQDLRIVNEAIIRGKGIVICPNKWDLMTSDNRFYFERSYEEAFDNYYWIPRINISAKNSKNIFNIFKAIEKVYDTLHKRISTARLNRLTLDIFSKNPHPVRGGKQPKIQYMSQVSVNPVKFVVFTTDNIDDAYKRFVIRTIRETFKFDCVPVLLSIRVRQKRRRR